MANIKPFKAVRPKKGLESKIAALPYDVYNRQEACEVVKGDHLTFLRIDRAETQFDASVDTYADEVYLKARQLYTDMLEDGNYVQDDQACFYLYELTMDGRSQTGFVALASVDDYINEVIKKHENTRADKEEDRIRHVDTVNAQTGPIFLAYRDREDLNQIRISVMDTQPYCDFTADDGIRHRCWQITDAQMIEKITEGFKALDHIYIADGHHRCASAVRVSQRRRANGDTNPNSEHNYFLSVLFSQDQLKIFDYNRVVKDLNGLTRDSFIEQIEKCFTVQKVSEKGNCYRPKKQGEFGMYLDSEWYCLTIKEECKKGDVVDDLDVSLLQDNLLKPILGIEDPKTDKRIDFVGGIRGLGELERRCETDCVVAFSMYPTSIGELFGVADENRLMPPKSTWFEPKLRSGLFIHDLA